ncbi:MAG: chlorite dismutase family protein [Isosphaeraceae bacterium]|nr:chlorite dismutase family protein [Isosphaeraceae bacterium]
MSVTDSTSDGGPGEEPSRRSFLRSGIGIAAIPMGAAEASISKETAPIPPEPTNPRLTTFSAGTRGEYRIVSMQTLVGDPLPSADRISIVPGTNRLETEGSTWTLRGVTSNERYVDRSEKRRLAEVQAPLGRATSDVSVLIPLRKTPAWWALTQEERREIFESRSHHIQIGLRALPAVARRLYHCRDLATVEPFDFITQFDFASADTAKFDELLAALRAGEEWRYIDRECEIRMVRD